ncbi:patatin-like phospholipase family protein [Bradyrhizobium sp. CIAT3101]|uniref:WD40 domain-containing protein n=1 Tax=Bradyrhizobium sp. CIAT3101 TaxID=439387 RepID=UPI0024B13B17|nr:patatin-like phospholipase family protein [Bradyrhizobium sp. CIAT3101]WFU79402.1 patatin-like phospholipase family protein [Bradyrhizobium sp. CIAT3101]
MLTADWGDAPSVSNSFGRANESALLKKWALIDRCQLIVLGGIRGCGKTRLSAMFANEISHPDDDRPAPETEGHFDYVIWRSLLNAPSLQSLVDDISHFLFSDRGPSSPNFPKPDLDAVLAGFREKRCLVILDNLESILGESKSTVAFDAKFREYEDFFQRIANTPHNSCVLVNGREIPYLLETLCGEQKPGRILRLEGLDDRASRQIIAAHGKVTGARAINRIIRFYQGHPLSLELTARFVETVYNGDAGQFLTSGSKIFRDIEEIIDWHFDRLAPAELFLIVCLALNREPIALEEIRQTVLDIDVRQQIESAIQSFQTRLPLVRSKQSLTLQPVIMEFVTQKVLSAVVREIELGEPELLDKHILLRATAKDYVRDIQKRLILDEAIRRARETSLNIADFDRKLARLLTRKRQLGLTGYTAGNVINLIGAAELPYSGRDFSNCIIRQAYLQGATMHGVDMSGSQFVDSVFTTNLGAVLCLALSPARDAVATGDMSGGVYLWRIGDGTQLRAFEGHTSWVRSIAFSPNAKTLATAGSDYTIRLWDVANGHCTRILKEHVDQIYSISFSRDGRLLASGGEDKQTIIWNPATGDIIERIAGTGGRVRAVKFSPTDDHLAIADNAITIWNYREHKLVVQFELGKPIRDLAYSNQGNVLACLRDDDGSIAIQQASNGRPITHIRDTNTRMLAIDFSHDDRMIVTTAEDGRIGLWQSRNGENTGYLSGHTASAKAIAARPIRNIVASGGDDQAVKVWDVDRRRCLATIRGYGRAVRSVAFAGTSGDLISGGEDGLVRIWSSGRRTDPSILSGHAGTIQSVSCSPDGRLIASGGNDGTVRIWDRRTEKCNLVLRDHDDWIWNVRFSPDGMLLAGAGKDNSVSVWNTSNGRQLHRLTHHVDEVHTVVFSPDGAQLFSGSDDHTIKVWSLRTGELVDELAGHTNCVRSIALSPGGALLASASDDETVRVWDLKTKQVKTLKGHAGRVRSVAFSPTDVALVSSGDDGFVYGWELESGTVKTTYRGHSDAVWSVAIGADARIATGSEDGTIRVWSRNAPSAVLQPKRPYENMNIHSVTGLTKAQSAALYRLGASNNPPAQTTTADQHRAPAFNGRALIIRGGGAKGIAYIGALLEIENRYSFDWYLGTSAGAILAVLLSAGYTAEELKDILFKTEFGEFLDAPWYKWPTNVLFHGGLHRADALIKWLDSLLAKKLNLTDAAKLADLPKRVTILASQRGKDALILDSANPKYDDMPASYAVRLSMTIPILFTPGENYGQRVLDGGLRNNFPLRHFLSEFPMGNFIGLYLGSERHDNSAKRHSLISDILSIVIDAGDVELLRKYQKNIIVIDPQPIGTLDFSLSDRQKNFLVLKGRRAAQRFLRNNSVIDPATSGALPRAE